MVLLSAAYVIFSNHSGNSVVNKKTVKTKSVNHRGTIRKEKKK